MIEHLRQHWYSYIKLAIIYAIVFQISFVFDLVWYNRTYTMLAYMLVISFFVHLFLSQINKILKLFLDYLLAFLVCLKFSEAWKPYTGQELYTFLEKVSYTIVDSYQFYLIGLSVLLLTHLMHYAIHSRKHFTIFFVLGFILMLIVDSFSPILLWKHNIALFVIYLIWHMFWHYEQIRKTNEDEFEVLINSPASIFTPVVTVVSVAIVIALIMPFGPPLLEDPYALWKKSRGEEVPAFLGEKGFKSNRENVRNRQSGYSRSNDKLGGGFNFNYETVLEITTSRKSYWRGETINYYTGEGWVDTLQNSGFTEVIPHVPFSAEHSRALATTEQIEAQIKVLREEPYPVLFHPSEPNLVSEALYTFHNEGLGINGRTQMFTDGEQPQIVYNSDSSIPGVKLMQKDNTLLFDMQNPTYPTAYAITADVLLLDVEKLVQTEAKHTDANLHRLYTSLPENLPQEVMELAEQITSQANSDYERAKLLEEYLKQNYAYSNEPNIDRLTGQADDFVYQFLFELYEGYCDYFSTAMAVMAKSLDMPARWVKGFSPGVNLSQQYLQQIQMSYADYEQLQNSLAGGTFNIRNADAHSWVEIYFEGYGWIAFEPTPGFSYTYDYVGQDTLLTPSAIDLAMDVEQDSITTQKNPISSKVWIILIVVIVSIGMLVVAWKKRASIKQFFIRWHYKRFSNNERIISQFNTFLHYCERRGLTRDKTDTVQEAILSWRHGSQAWKQQLIDCYQLFEQAKYSAKQMDDEHVRKVNELIEHLKKQW